VAGVQKGLLVVKRVYGLEEPRLIEQPLKYT